MALPTSGSINLRRRFSKAKANHPPSSKRPKKSMRRTTNSFSRSRSNWDVIYRQRINCVYSSDQLSSLHEKIKNDSSTRLVLARLYVKSVVPEKEAPAFGNTWGDAQRSRATKSSLLCVATRKMGFHKVRESTPSAYYRYPFGKIGLCFSHLLIAL